MTEAVIVALITGGLTALASVISNIMTNNAHDAVVDEKIDQLTREVRAHNNFAKRLPVVEHDIELLHKELERHERRDYR